MITKEDILDYARIHGSDSALNLLALAGPDGFKGTIDDYKTLERELKKGGK